MNLSQWIAWAVAASLLVACVEEETTIEEPGGDTKSDVFNSSWSMARAIQDCESVYSVDLRAARSEDERVQVTDFYALCLSEINNDVSDLVQGYHSDDVRDAFADYRSWHTRECKSLVYGGSLAIDGSLGFELSRCYAEIEENLAKSMRRFVKLPQRRSNLSLESFQPEYETCFEEAGGQLRELNGCIQSIAAEKLRDLEDGLEANGHLSVFDEFDLQGGFEAANASTEHLCYLFAHTDENRGRTERGELRDSCSAIFSIWRDQRMNRHLEVP